MNASICFLFISLLWNYLNLFIDLFFTEDADGCIILVEVIMCWWGMGSAFIFGKHRPSFPGVMCALSTAANKNNSLGPPTLSPYISLCWQPTTAFWSKDYNLNSLHSLPSERLLQLISLVTKSCGQTLLYLLSAKKSAPVHCHRLCIFLNSALLYKESSSV